MLLKNYITIDIRFISVFFFINLSSIFQVGQIFQQTIDYLTTSMRTSSDVFLLPENDPNTEGNLCYNEVLAEFDHVLQYYKETKLTFNLLQFRYSSFFFTPSDNFAEQNLLSAFIKNIMTISWLVFTELPQNLLEKKKKKKL